MKLYIIRHGETYWNIEGRLQGRTDIELTPSGISIADRSSQGMKNIRFDYIFSSPLKRAYKTAEIIRRDRSIPIITDNRLIEVCFGNYEGMIVDNRNGNLALFFDNPEAFIPCNGAESYEEILGRSREFIEDVIYPLAEKNPESTALISGHGGINKALMTILLGSPLSDFWKGTYRGNCAVDVFQIANGNISQLEEAKYYYEKSVG